MDLYNAASGSEQLPKAVMDSVASVVRQRLHVTLSQRDGRARNQDALELVNDIYADIWSELLKPRSEPIANLVGYAKTVAKHRVNDYFRGTSPVYKSLLDRLRYWFRNVPGYAIWEGEKEDMCGPAGWANGHGAIADPCKVAQLRDDPGLLGIAKIPEGDLDALERKDWESLVDAVFHFLEGSVRFKDLAGIIAARVRIVEPREESFAVRDGEEGEEISWEPTSPDPTPEKEVLLAETTRKPDEKLRQFWNEILQLQPRQRLAYLLNPTESIHLDWLVELGIASWEKLSQAIGMNELQFATAWADLSMSSEDRALADTLTDPHECFYLLSNYLPLQDLLIAKLLGATRTQVINLRKCARERLKRRIPGFGAGEKK
jgi:hypothetical protein